MTLPFDCVVLSTNLDRHYWPFYHLVGEAWKKLFNVPVHLGVVGDPKEREAFSGGFPIFSSDTIKGSVHWLDTVPGVPDYNQAKMARYYVAANLNAMTRVLVQDINYLPLSKEITLWLLAPERTIERHTTNLYFKPNTAAPLASPLMTTAGELSRLLSPTHLGWAAFVNKLKSHPLSSDPKANVSNKLDPGETEAFSSASIVPKLFSAPGQPSVSDHHWPAYGDRVIDRNLHAITPEKLRNGHYAGVYLPGPFDRHWPEIKPVADHLGLG